MHSTTHYSKGPLVKKILVLAAFMAAVTAVSAQSQRIAYIESDVILKQLPEAQDAEKTLKDLGQKFQDTLMQMQKTLQEKSDQLKGPISEEGKAKIRAEGEQLQQAAMAYQNAKFDQQNGEYFRKQAELLAPIKERVTKAIEELSKEEKIGFVFDKAGGLGMIYAEDKNDITFKILDRMKRGK